MEILTRSEQETCDFANDFEQKLKSNDIVLLQGDLGVGKSVFARALIRTLCSDETMEVPSPTFTLVQCYDGQQAKKPCRIWHFDLYRLSDPQEIYEIGWEEALTDGIVLVEWPERLGALLPQNCIEITFQTMPDQPDHRTIRVEKT
jgi:tRNA threonylcarbamoyl adenosine modification protein YjeE